eukprot:4938240-Pleurochrysis_carterae.AAC.1
MHADHGSGQRSRPNGADGERRHFDHDVRSKAQNHVQEWKNVTTRRAPAFEARLNACAARHAKQSWLARGAGALSRLRECVGACVCVCVCVRVWCKCGVCGVEGGLHRLREADRPSSS